MMKITRLKVSRSQPNFQRWILVPLFLLKNSYYIRMCPAFEMQFFLNCLIKEMGSTYSVFLSVTNYLATMMVPNYLIIVTMATIISEFLWLMTSHTFKLHWLISLSPIFYSVINQVWIIIPKYLRAWLGDSTFVY